MAEGCYGDGRRWEVMVVGGGTKKKVVRLCGIDFYNLLLKVDIALLMGEAVSNQRVTG